MNRVKQILILTVFSGFITSICGNTLQEDNNTNHNRPINNNVDSQKVHISSECLSDTLFAGEVSIHHINLTNESSESIAFQISGDFIKTKEFQNYAAQYNSTKEYINCGNLGFGKDVKAITIEIWYKPFDYTRECGVWEFVCPDSAFMFTSGIWARKYSVKNRGHYMYYLPLEENVWRHIAITWNGKEQKLYENGKQLELSYIDMRPSRFTGPNLDLFQKPFYIGTKDSIRHRAYGIIDEVRVWNKVKSEYEILHEMNRELSGLEVDLIGYWNFNEEDGNTAFDKSGNNHHGRLYNGVQRVTSTAPVSSFYWIEISPDSVILKPGESKEIVLKIDTKDLKGGDYFTNLFITPKEADYPIDTLPVSIHVIDAPHISVSQDTINLYDVFAGELYSENITISNTGYKQLSINDITIGNNDFEIDTSSFILDECQNQTINIAYKPSLFSRRISKLVIHSNDPVFPKKEIILSRDQLMVSKDKLIRWILISALVLLLVFLGMIYYRYRLKNKLNKELEWKVKQAVEKQQEQQKIIIHQSGIASLGELAAGISEEINQPLQNIFHAAEVQDMELNEKNIDVKQLEKMIGEQYAEIGKIKEIVDHIRIFSSQQKMNIFEEFSIIDCIHNTILIIKQQYQNNLIHLQLELAENLPMISGNPHKLEQVLINVLNNSRDAVNLKFAKVGTEYRKEILIKTVQLDGGITIQVEDNGIGIPDKNMAFIFEPFFTTKESDKRIGLGLAIALEIINEMNGTIDVQSDLQSGTKVYINVPVGPGTLYNKA